MVETWSLKSFAITTSVYEFRNSGDKLPSKANVAARIFIHLIPNKDQFIKALMELGVPA